ncbi:glycosyltransferase [soil metagenome]
MNSRNRNDLVTVIVVQRERFSTTMRSLESLFACTEPGYRLIYIDAGSPRRVRNYLAKKSADQRFELVREEHYLSPAHARNIGLSLATTKYVAFVDNDVLFSPGWLEALVSCAEETGADVVTPLIFQNEPALTTVHVAGGTITISEKEDTRELEEIQRYLRRPLSEVEDSLKREPTGMAEFHCMLAKKDLCDRIGGLDPNLLATSEHLDFSLTVSRNRGTIFFEPLSRITYVAPPPVTLEDLQYFSLRWSDEWIQYSEDYFFEKWNVVPFKYVLEFAKKYRRRWLRKPAKLISMILGKRAGIGFADRVEGMIVALARRRQAKHITELLDSRASADI